ncbi:MAG: hypothetical protein Q3993_08975 [Filifactor alocis]|nr:hypothetical protein [Filifactor alocis]
MNKKLLSLLAFILVIAVGSVFVYHNHPELFTNKKHRSLVVMQVSEDEHILKTLDIINEEFEKDPNNFDDKSIDRILEEQHIPTKKYGELGITFSYGGRVYSYTSEGKVVRTIEEYEKQGKEFASQTSEP